MQTHLNLYLISNTIYISNTICFSYSNDLSNIEIIPTIGTINCGLDVVSIIDCFVTFNTECADFTSLAGVVCDEDNG